MQTTWLKAFKFYMYILSEKNQIWEWFLPNWRAEAFHFLKVASTCIVSWLVLQMLQALLRILIKNDLWSLHLFFLKKQPSKCKQLKSIVKLVVFLIPENPQFYHFKI